MAPIKSKQFKKQYVTSTDNITDRGVWSGRGIGIPSAGAIGGGDDYKQKIGRGKLPDFRTGRPTQGADSTFSSYLARVNTGYDDVYLDIPMFPEQEAEDEDIYYGDEPGHIRSRKLPKDFKIKRPRIQGIREMKFEDDKVVNSSKYSLVAAMDIMAGDEIDENVTALRLAGKGAARVIAKGTKSALLSVPVLDAIIGVPIMLYALHQVKNASDGFINDLSIPENTLFEALTTESEQAWQELVVHAVNSPLETREDVEGHFNEMLDAIKGMLITFIQAADTILAGGTALAVGAPIPAPEEIVTVPAFAAISNLATGIGGFIADIVPVERFIFAMSTKGAEQLESALNSISSSSTEDASALEDMGEEGGATAMAVLRHPVRAFRRLGQMYSALNETSPVDQVVAAVPQAVARSAGVSMPSNFDQMELEELRSFVRESVYPDYPSYHPAYPTGFEYRAVPVVVSKEEADTEFETLDDYDNFAVAYKTDGGVVSYQDRNKLVKEAALRNIIRRKIISIVESNKKKENY